VNIVYPDLDNIVLPEIKINNEEWQSVLKNCSRLYFKISSTFFFDDALIIFLKFYRSQLIHPSNMDVRTKWGLYNPNSIVQSRLVITCAGLMHDKEDITNEREDQLNELLEKIWRTLQEKVLQMQLAILNFRKTHFEIAGNFMPCYQSFNR
jgi:hypothetical protein